MQFDSARNLSGKQERVLNALQHPHSTAGGRSLKSAMRKPKTLLNLNRISISNSIVSDKPEAVRNRRAELVNLFKTMQRLTAHPKRWAWELILEEAVQAGDQGMQSSRKKLSIIVNEGQPTNIEIPEIRIPRISPSSRLAYYQPELTPIPSVRESFREPRPLNTADQPLDFCAIQRQPSEQSWPEEQNLLKSQALPLFLLLLNQEVYAERRTLRQSFDLIKQTQKREIESDFGQALTPHSEVVGFGSPVFLQAR